MHYYYKYVKYKSKYLNLQDYFIKSNNNNFELSEHDLNNNRNEPSYLDGGKRHSKVVTEIRYLLMKSVDIPAEKRNRFFKVNTGDYAYGDKFIGVSVPAIRKIAQRYEALSFPEIEELLSSPINEERLLALIILVKMYRTSQGDEKEGIYNFYIDNIKHINNWNLVDSSAHLIMGDYLLNRDRKILFSLAKSDNVWERRIAIVSTLAFIRNGDLDSTFNIAKLLLNDKHDLIHKATGWMLREAGKQNAQSLIEFLDLYSDRMPRTMLRYSIEKFPPNEKKKYLAIKKVS